MNGSHGLVNILSSELFAVFGVLSTPGSTQHFPTLLTTDTTPEKGSEEISYLHKHETRKVTTKRRMNHENENAHETKRKERNFKTMNPWVASQEALILGPEPDHDALRCCDGWFGQVDVDLGV